MLLDLNFHCLAAVSAADEPVLGDPDVHKGEPAVRAGDGGDGHGHGGLTFLEGFLRVEGRSERRGGTSRTGDPRRSEKRSAAFGDRGVGVPCSGGGLHELAGDGAAVMSSAAAVGAPLGDRGPGVARRGGRLDIPAGGCAAVMSLGH